MANSEDLSSTNDFCCHCNEKVSKTLYFRHKRLYYSSEEQRWQTRSLKDETMIINAEEDFTFCDSENSIEGKIE